MTTDDSATAAVIAAWVAASFGGLFGLTGFILGLVGLRHARQAKLRKGQGTDERVG